MSGCQISYRHCCMATGRQQLWTLFILNSMEKQMYHNAEICLPRKKKVWECFQWVCVTVTLMCPAFLKLWCFNSLSSISAVQTPSGSLMKRCRSVLIRSESIRTINILRETRRSLRPATSRIHTTADSSGLTWGSWTSPSLTWRTDNLNRCKLWVQSPITEITPVCQTVVFQCNFFLYVFCNYLKLNWKAIIYIYVDTYYIFTGVKSGN